MVAQVKRAGHDKRAPAPKTQRTLIFQLAGMKIKISYKTAYCESIVLLNVITHPTTFNLKLLQILLLEDQP
jgi:hypothetical protein